jgi:catechol 2,3-dioxygenase-like lactoylglutathione lyase family enzyme
MADVRFEQAAPILCVAAIEAAIAFYAGLGFELVARFESYALLRRDAVSLHVRVPSPVEGMGPEANPCGMYVYLHGVDAFAAGLREQGVALLGNPVNQPYGVRKFAVSDPDGNLLRFGELLG